MAERRTRGRTRTERQEVTASDFGAELERLSDAAESINAMVYGDSGAGKTHLTSTLPGQILYLVCEPGYKVAARQGAKGFARKIGDSATALACVDWLYEKERYKKLSWIVLDGLSTMQDRIRLAYTAEAFDTKGSRAHRNLPDKPDYFNTQNFLKSWIPQLVDLPVNLLITAHAYRTDKIDNGDLMIFPGIQGKVTETANSIAGLMDFTGFLEPLRIRSKRDPDQVRKVRRLWFDATARKGDVTVVCGDKFNRLGPYIDNPTMPQILSKINGEEE